MSIKRAGVIGYPVKHSLSPRIYEYFFKQVKIKGVYDIIEVKPEDLESFIASIPNLSGFNVTIPHKEKLFKLLGKNVSFEAREIGAINTVKIDDDGVLWGSNSDVYGFLEPLRKEFDFCADSRIAVLGAGGAARAVLYGLKKKTSSISGSAIGTS